MGIFSAGSAAASREIKGLPKIVVLASNNCWNLAHFREPLIRDLVGSGIRVVAIAPRDGYEKSLVRMGVEHIPIALQRSGISPVADLALIRRYRAILKTLRPNALLGFTVKPNIYASLAARGLGIKVINNISGLGTAFLSGEGLLWLVSRLYRVALARSSTVFFQNADDRDLFVSRGLVRAECTVLLPGSGIDLDRFAAVPSPEPHPTTRFLFIGRLLRDKGLVELVEAARILHDEGCDIEVRLLGATDRDNRSAISESELNSWQTSGLIDRLGATDDVRAAITAADCVVLPSYREGLPRSLIEAAALARPAIATDVPGCRHIVEPGTTGWLVPARDAGALAGAMREMSRTTPSARATMGAKARALVERSFDQRIVIEAYRVALGLSRTTAVQGA